MNLAEGQFRQPDDCEQEQPERQVAKEYCCGHDWSHAQQHGIHPLCRGEHALDMQGPELSQSVFDVGQPAPTLIGGSITPVIGMSVRRLMNLDRRVDLVAPSCQGRPPWQGDLDWIS